MEKSRWLVYEYAEHIYTERASHKFVAFAKVKRGMLPTEELEGWCLILEIWEHLTKEDGNWPLNIPRSIVH